MPGTTSATLYVKPTMLGVLTVNASSAAFLYLFVRGVSGLYNGSGVKASKNTRNLKSMLPAASVPIGHVMVQGERLPVQIDDLFWYSFFRYITQTVLGGPIAPTLPDVTTALTVAQVQGIAQAAVSAGLTQQAVANAASLSAVVQVTQTAALPGAAQIPPVVLVPPETGGGD